MTDQMTQRNDGILVMPKGAIKGMTGGAVGGAIGAAIATSRAGTAGSSPVEPGKLAYLTAGPGGITLYVAKRGAFKAKVTDEVLATAPIGDIERAGVSTKLLNGVVDIALRDGATWQFDVPRVKVGRARRVLSALPV